MCNRAYYLGKHQPIKLLLIYVDLLLQHDKFIDILMENLIKFDKFPCVCSTDEEHLPYRIIEGISNIRSEVRPYY